MNKTIYIATVSIVIVILVLAGNNFYQTRQAKINKELNAVKQNTSIGNYPVDSSGSALEKKTTQAVLAVINIGGFDCPSCPIIAENALKDSKGVLDAKTTSTGEGSRVLYDANVTTIEEVSKALPSQNSVTVISENPSQSSKLE